MAGMQQLSSQASVAPSEEDHHDKRKKRKERLKMAWTVARVAILTIFVVLSMVTGDM